MTQTVIDPAPPPCEACGWPRTQDPCLICGPNPYRDGGHLTRAHVRLQTSDREIAKLRALLAEYIDWHDDELGVDTPAEGNEPYWLERARAALAPKEGK